MPKKRTAKKNKKSKSRVVWIIIAFLLFLVAFCVFKYAKTTDDSDAEILTGLKNQIQIKTSEIAPDQAVWIQSPTELIILKGVSFTSETELNDGENVPLLEASKTYMYHKKFLENDINTFSTLNTDNVYQVQSQGFVSGDMKCLFNVFLQSMPSGYFFCGVNDDEKNKLQQEFMSVVYGPHAQYPLQKNETAVLNVSKINDEFATGSNNRYLNGIYEPSGTTWIAAKVNGVWKLVFDSQDYPTCAAVDEYNVPKEFYKNCYEQASGKFRFDL